MASFASQLASKNKEQLIEILFEKGNKRKQTLHEATVYQTIDWAATEQSLYDMQSQVGRLQEQKNEYLNQVNDASQGLISINKEIDDLNIAITGKENDLRQQASGANSNKYKEAMQECVQQVTPEMIKKINKLLEDDGPVPLTKVLEHFVALLRNKAGSKNVDVELFLADHAKLVSKMGKTETNSCALAVVRAASEVMAAQAPLFVETRTKAEADISPYKVFIDWSDNFCAAAEIDMKKDDIIAELNAMRASKEQKERERDNMHKKKADADRHNFAKFYDSAIRNIQLRLEEMQKIVEMDRDQATEYQTSLHKFEKTYFSKVFQILSEQ